MLTINCKFNLQSSINNYVPKTVVAALSAICTSHW